MTTNKYFKFFVSLFLPLAIGGVSGFLTMDSVSSWYVGLVKPALNPPSWVFGPVWTTLYVAMGLALYIVWTTSTSQSIRKAQYVFFTQLAVNFLWSILFFSVKSPALALVDVVILWLLILWNIVLFYKISKTAGYLLVPYLLWVSFASYLNLSIYLLN